jgi:chorismate mutase
MPEMTCAHNPEHEVRERLKKAIREKHGRWPDEAERLFKRLRLQHKEETDSQIMQLVEERMKKTLRGEM